MPELISLVENFHEAVRKMWMTENKIFGYEIQDIRIGALEARLKSAVLRLKQYFEGSVNALDELEAERLFYTSWTNPQGTIHTNVWYSKLT